jgi:hypothetical protein
VTVSPDTAPAGIPRVRRRLPWKDIPRGLQVRITSNGKYVGQGIVDCSTPDGLVLWVLFDGMEGRRMFHSDDNVFVEVG